MFELQLGELQVIGSYQSAKPPAKLIKALAVIADRLHPAFDARIPKGKSKESCVLCALTVRDFLRTIGFAARVEPVSFYAIARRDGVQLHSIGIGAAGAGEVRPGKWNGHLVTIVADWLIDTTLYQAQRPAWPHLPAMIAIPISHLNHNGTPILAALRMDGDDGYLFDAAWMLRPNRSWRLGPDAFDKRRRDPVTWKLVERFGGWSE
jgi:hypothetical protein